MNRTACFLTIAALLVSSTALADEDLARSHEQICREMAEEEEIAPDKLDRYLAWCLDDLASPEPPDGLEGEKDGAQPMETPNPQNDKN